MAADSASAPDHAPVPARATALLRRPRLWLLPTVLSGLLALLLALLYMGGIVDPDGALRDLPIGIVDTDQGGPLPGQTTNLGAQLTRAVAADTSGKADWQRLTRAQLQDRLTSGKIFGALVVPADFTASVSALTTSNATARPTLTVLTNPGLGSLGSSLALPDRPADRPTGLADHRQAAHGLPRRRGGRLHGPSAAGRPGDGHHPGRPPHR